MKKIILLLTAILIMISTIGCTESDLENYKSAMDKTDNMSKGTVQIEMSSKMDFNTEGLDDEIIKSIEKFKEWSMTIRSRFDKGLGKGIDEGYVVAGGLGYDFNIYELEEKIYIEPLFINLKDKRFIEINPNEFSTDTEDSEDLFKVFSYKWSEILKEDNVMKGEKVLITTDDGEVKSREFTISLNDEQLKELLIFIIEYMEQNDEYKDIFDEMVTYSEDIELTEEEKDKVYVEIMNVMKEFITDADELNLFYKAYIDIDNYVVKEDITFNFKNGSKNSGELQSIIYDMVIQYENIEKEQNIEFENPELSNTIKLEDIDWEELKW